MLAWYFARENNRLKFNDHRLITIGKMHTVKCAPILCCQGLHGSVQLLDALHYAPGPMLYRVDITRKLDIEGDKICGQRRKYLGVIDATEVVRRFTRNQALINIEKIKPHCAASQYELILDWLKTGNPRLRVVAQTAAKAAATAARSAAWSTVLPEAWHAARFADMAARSAVLPGTWYAIQSAARDAVLPDARSTANEMLTQMVEAVMLGDA